MDPAERKLTLQVLAVLAVVTAMLTLNYLTFGLKGVIAGMVAPVGLAYMVMLLRNLFKP